MKNIFISFTIFICMLLTIIFSINYLNKIYANIENLNNNLEQFIEGDDWNSSYKLVNEISDELDKHSSKISIFVNHSELDNIKSEFNKLTQYIKYHNKDEAMASLYAVKFFFQHTLKLERISIENIL
ncbi:putative membrane protein YvbJ [Clostridium tetanomorphum]|uniref:DUF4363 family protein n=1 Tax=Clostridium tetanomorphum TaxID=1553 RepID=A0A923ECI9_CLOTT|nr:DUF4363 family protein [Clostridium tetanomorphum]KAJ50434.1 hypothetical protein CTM_18286 [Clostridium tetanomorphum DSM 665]MBC2399442.1 DUF4363 family protein [Clostridium tetanomorphum]MBP1865751.1 putative membrane protein YvbJ [Clostridium tetanomorphum]NRS86873.1 putative membrane protein YvbJ [Clostridium tetanomorphum]NRZ99371.1 putative membrane protein YvbJ [Clostridium tetanomorphum]